jgi:hypothetical protein
MCAAEATEPPDPAKNMHYSIIPHNKRDSLGKESHFIGICTPIEMNQF